MARPAGSALSRDRAASSGLGQLGAAEVAEQVDDLAYLYLDLADELELARRDAGRRLLRRLDRGRDGGARHARVRRLVLADPLGIKVGGVLDRDIADMHAMPRDEYMRLAWADPAKRRARLHALPESELAAIARGREAFALFGWKPYMHNPRLKRWLHRIDMPTLLLWGEQDGIVSTNYCQAWRGEIPGARLEVIANAGHFPHWEQPEASPTSCAFVDTN